MNKLKILMSKFWSYLNTDKIFQTAWRVLVFKIVMLTIFNILLRNTNAYDFHALPILKLLVSVISIIIAIIVTYLFSKLFAEKSERIQRKHIIDELSHKITLFRKIAFHIKDMHSFWETCNSRNPKTQLDNKYKHLTYHQYINDLSYEQLTAIDKEIGYIKPYLALRGLENDETIYSFFTPFRPTNYTLDEISHFHDFASTFWNFLDRAGDHIHFNNVSNYTKNTVNGYFKEITGKEINDKNYRKEIKELFGDIQSDVFGRIYYLTKLNGKRFPKLFLS